MSAEPAVAPRLPEGDEAWIGLGTNLGDRGANLLAARTHLAELGEVVVVSPVYETAPWGIEEQPWFLNGVLRLRWGGGAEALVERCLAIERAMGRVRQRKNGPRLIDLDVLVVGQQQARTERAVVPHPGIASRRSVLEPWAAAAPELVLPTLGRTVAQLAEAAADLDQPVRAWVEGE